MKSHPVKQVIEAADRAIAAEDFDTLMDFYAEDAILVIKPEHYAIGKEQIRSAFVKIAEYFNHSVSIRQENMLLLEGSDTVLVLSESVISYIGKDDAGTSITRQATYVFRKCAGGKWLCVIDNSYGTSLLLGAKQASQLLEPF